MTSDLMKLDVAVWEEYISWGSRTPTSVGSNKLFTCVCPKCSGGRKKKKKLSSSNGTNPSYHSACVYLRPNRKGYGFTCANRKCGLKYSSALSLLAEISCGCAGEAYKEYFEDSSIKQKVFSETFETCSPIKNQVPYEDRKPSKKKTFKEKQEIKSAALQIKMDGKSKS